VVLDGVSSPHAILTAAPLRTAIAPTGRPPVPAVAANANQLRHGARCRASWSESDT
jgi:hypothetical protein